MFEVAAVTIVMDDGAGTDGDYVLEVPTGNRVVGGELVLTFDETCLADAK